MKKIREKSLKNNNNNQEEKAFPEILFRCGFQN